VGPRVDLIVTEKIIALAGNRRPARNPSLYQLTYHGSVKTCGNYNNRCYFQSIPPHYVRKQRQSSLPKA
jgi:hypothetical protein